MKNNTNTKTPSPLRERAGVRMFGVRVLLTTFLCLLTLGAMGKSLVLTLNDKKSTRVFYLLDKNNPPRMEIADDGTFTLNGQDYEFSGIKHFEISATDYSGEKNTVEGAPYTDGIVSISGDDVLMQGTLRIYTLDGRLVETTTDRASLKQLSRGTYIITNGQQTLKLRKQ